MSQASPITIDRRRGFTLLELMIVIGVLAVLISILALGGRSVMKTVKNNSTKVTLDNIVSLQFEYEASATKLENENIISTDPIRKYVRADQLANLNLTGDTKNDYQAIYTQRALRIMCRNARVKTALNKMPRDSVGVVDVHFAPYIPFPTDQAYKSNGFSIAYLKGDVVKYNNKFYLCRANVTNDIAVPGTAPGYWRDLGTDNPNPVYVPVDAWGNQLRYVGAYGLDRLKVDPGSTKLWYGPDPNDMIGPPTPTESTYAASAMPDGVWTWFKRKLTSPNYTPFWVSAGPDGDFMTHDDNVYSFEN